MEIESTDSLNSVDESSVLNEACGELERRLVTLAAAYARSLSALVRCMLFMLSSVPLAVSVGFVIGAEIVEVTA